MNARAWYHWNYVKKNALVCPDKTYIHTYIIYKYIYSRLIIMMMIIIIVIYTDIFHNRGGKMLKTGKNS